MGDWGQRGDHMALVERSVIDGDEECLGGGRGFLVGNQLGQDF